MPTDCPACSSAHETDIVDVATPCLLSKLLQSERDVPFRSMMNEQAPLLFTTHELMKKSRINEQSPYRPAL